MDPMQSRVIRFYNTQAGREPNTCTAAVERAGLKAEDIEEVLVGNVMSAK